MDFVLRTRKNKAVKSNDISEQGKITGPVEAPLSWSSLYELEIRQASPCMSAGQRKGGAEGSHYQTPV